MDTIDLQEALNGFTSNESSDLGAYIGTNGKQSIAALAKVAAELRYKGSIVAGTDLADLEDGIWRHTANTDVNGSEPAGVVSQSSVVISWGYGSQYGIQIWIAPINNRLFVRGKWVGVLKSWNEVSMSALG